MVLLLGVGCSLNSKLTDFNALTPPVLLDSNGDRLESLVINSGTNLSSVKLQGECYYEDQEIQVSFVPQNSSLSVSDTRNFKALCKNKKFSLNVDTQNWSDTDYRIVLAVTSLAGVSSSSESAALKDVVAPVVSFGAPISAEVGNDFVGAVSVGGACETDDGPVEILSEGVLLNTFTCLAGSFSGTISVAGLDEGLRTFTVQQKDLAGNIGTNVSTTFNKDTVAPLLPVTLGSLGSALSNNDAPRTVTVGTPTDGGTQYKYIVVKDTDCSGQWAAIMATTPVPAGTPISLSFSGDGVYRICTIGGDQANNWQGPSSVVESSAVVIDKTAPALTITTPLAGAKFQSAFTLSGACEAGLTVNISGDFTPSPTTTTCSVTGTYAANLSLTGVDGAKNISVSSTDAAGNASSIAFYSVTKDTTIIPPNVTLNTPATTNAALAKFTVNDCSDHTFILMKEQNTPPALGDSGWISCSTAAQSYIYDLSASDQQGLRNVRFYARDEAGNISTATVFTVTYDSKAPILSLDPVPTLAINVSYPFVVYVTETTVSASAVLTLQYSTNGGTTWNFAASRALGLAGPMNAKSFVVNWAPPSYQVGMKVRAMLTDDNGLTGYGVSNAFDAVVDTIAPVISANQMKINGSLTPSDTVRSYVTVSLQAHDGETAITDFCFKTTNSAPATSDACWVSVKAPKPGLEELPDLLLVDFDFFLGINFGTYNIYAWVRDVAGNISTNSATLKKDFNTINYINDAPPTVSNFLTVNSTTPNTPPINADMNFANGASVYIKWAASDNGSISKVELYSSTDGSQYTLISDTLSNSSSNGASCSYSAPHTGCWVWNSSFPNNSFFKLQLRVTDNYGQTSQVTSPPLNSQNLNLLAGNQDAGHNGNAKKTVFNTTVGNDMAPGTLLVTTDGKIFFNDSSYGLMYIDPKTNNSKVLLRLAKTGEDSYGDGIPVEQARAKAILRTTLDYQNRILVYDRYMIRRIDTNVEPMTIETLIGADPAGNLGTNTADTVADPRDLKINLTTNVSLDESWTIRKRSIFVALPNGDIYFVSDKPGVAKDNGGRIRVYKGSLAVPRVESIRFSGTGVKDLPSWDLNTQPYSFFSLRYDPQTSDILKAYVNAVYSVPGNSYGNMTELDPTTWIGNGVYPNHPFASNNSLVYYDVQSLDGRVYRSNRYTEHSVSRLNDDGTWTRVLGTGAMGDCADGTAATSCAVSLDDAFVDRYGRIFFSTRGIIRTVYNGNVYTLFGQRKDAGDGGAGLDMRLASVFYIDHGVGNNVIMLDHQENKIREMRPGASPEVQLIAGNGQSGIVDYATAANAQKIPLGNWGEPNSFATNPATGDLYMNCSLNSVLVTAPSTYVNYHRICKLNRATGMWEQILDGEGATPSYTQTSLSYADLQLTGYSPAVMAFQAGSILFNQFYWNGTAQNNSHLRLVTPTSTEFVAGTIAVDSSTDSCPDGASTSCNLGVTGMHRMGAPVYYGPLSGWLFNPTRTTGSSYEGVMHVVHGGMTHKFLTLPSRPSGFTYDSGNIYYCTGGKLYKANITNAGDLSSVANWPLVENTHYTITQLTMPADNITCEGRRILVKPASGPKPKRLVMMAKQNGLPALIEYFLP
ncbi:hemagglutinin [Bdellovibrio sp. BCCA]|uniref:hemagglutinin n=1 Tax=Bdellovibrio sp. BCCA TaxID=3136281 RepID=UPI0030F05AB7